MPAQILVVEDEQAIRELLTFLLEKEQFNVTTVASSNEARLELANNTIDLALIDWMLPGGSGLEFVRHIRSNAENQLLPVIMLTAKTEEADITSGLDAGADDYITKPFSPKVLVSRINALLRRSAPNNHSNGPIEVAGLTLNPHTHRCTANGEPVELGHTEFKLLKCLASSPDRVFSRAQLLDIVWGNHSNIEERTVDVHILRLRKVLKPVAMDHLLETVRGAGYRVKKNTQ